MPLLFLWACTTTSNDYNRQQVRENTCYQQSMMGWRYSLACLETRQLSHSWLGCMILGNPVAIFFSPIILSVGKFTCLSLACHSQAGSTSVINREVCWLVSNSILYRWLYDHFTFINKVPFMSNILRNELANFTLLSSSIIWPRLIMLLFKFGT